MTNSSFLLTETSVYARINKNGKRRGASSVRYFSFTPGSSTLNTNSRRSEELPLIVNCAGKIDLCEPFTTYNACGRLDYYLMYITEGRLSTECLGEQITVSAGDFIIFPPHYKYKYSLKSGRVVYYFVHFTGSYPEKLLELLGLCRLPAVLHAGHSEQVFRCFSDILDAYMGCDAFRNVELCTYLEEALTALCKLHSAGGEKPLSRSLSYIRVSYVKDIRVPELAAMESLSVSRYNALFRKTLGVSPVRYITDMRMKHACSLLESTDLSVKTIAEIVGYSDNHFFSKTFKRRIGISASEYRRMTALCETE